MKVRASFFGPIRRPWPEQSREVLVTAGADARALLENLGYGEDDLRRVAVVINGRRRPLDTVLLENDDVRLVLLAGGG